MKKNEAYFRAAWKNAVDLCVFLCREYGLTEKDIIGHAEGYRQGIASNHADPMHWFPKHGESMDTFRAAVKIALNPKKGSYEGYYVGDIVEIKSSAGKYYPGGPNIPSWVKSTYHLVTQNRTSEGVVLRGGKEAVLLGKKVHKRTGDKSPGIMTWVDKDILELVNQKTEVNSSEKFYRVQVGAFSKKENAEALMDRLKKAGFDAHMKYD